jgi:hypothetical protein
LSRTTRWRSERGRRKRGTDLLKRLKSGQPPCLDGLLKLILKKKDNSFFQFLNLNKWKNTKLPLSNRRYPFTFRVLTFAVSVAVLAFFCVVASSQILPQGYTCLFSGAKVLLFFERAK